MKTYIGMELGSTRIKSVLIDEKGRVEASGSYTWENQLENGLWTYAESEIWKGVQESFSALMKDYGKPLELSAMGFSA